MVQVPVSRAAKGDVDNYYLSLENEQLLITETDGRYGFGVHFGKGNSHFEVRRDEKGRITGFDVRVGDLTYSDLDGNGRIDGYTGPG